MHSSSRAQQYTCCAYSCWREQRAQQYHQITPAEAPCSIDSTNSSESSSCRSRSSIYSQGISFYPWDLLLLRLQHCDMI